MRSVISAAALLLAFTGTGTGVAEASPTPEVSASTYGSQAHQAINKQRARHGRSRLKVDDCMLGSARRQALRMAASEDVNDTQDVGVVYRKCDLHYALQQSAVGLENGTKTIDQIYMRYARDLVLNRRHEFMAVAARQGESGKWYVMAIFGERT